MIRPVPNFDVLALETRRNALLFEFEHLLGHEKPFINCGLYRGGTSLAVKAEALAKLSYPNV